MFGAALLRGAVLSVESASTCVLRSRAALPPTFLLQTQGGFLSCSVWQPQICEQLVPGQRVRAAASVAASAPSLPQITGPRGSVVTGCL